MRSKDRVLSRLAGLNVNWAFDVEGKGTIDAVVFSRVLKRFDSDVFTDESVSELLELLAGEEGAAPVIQIQKFAEMVDKSPPITLVPPPSQSLAIPSTTSTPRAHALVPRSPSCSRHAAALDDYMDGLVCDLEDFREAVNPASLVAASGDSPEELEALKHQLQEKAKAFVLDAQRKNIRPVWLAFDRNRDGALSKEECCKLVKEYLKALAPKIGEVVRGTMELGAELQVLIYEKKVTDPAARQLMREQAKKQVDIVYGKVSEVTRETLEKMATEDPDMIAMELLEDLDADKDGKVTQEEFESRFVEAIQQVLGPDRMMERLQRRH